MTYRSTPIAEITDIRHLIWDAALWPELVNRARYYDRFIQLVAQEERAGVRDLYLEAGRRVFRFSMRGVRADLRRALEVQQLERMADLPWSPRRSGS